MSTADDVLARAAFSVPGRTFRWSDVAGFGRARGEWDRLESAARAGLCDPPDPAEIPAGALAAAEDEFRYDRNLLAADDLEAWLECWAVDVDDWLDYLCVAVRGPAAPGPVASGADPADLARVTWAHLVCSGTLMRLGRELADLLAAGLAMGDLDVQLPVPDLLPLLESRWSALRARATAEPALERRVRSEQLEWTRLEIGLLAHHDADVLREAALGVRVDGRALAEMARPAGARCEPALRHWLGDLGRDLRTRLVAATPGDLIGPFPVGGEQWLVAVHARIPPCLDDPDVRQRAQTTVADEAVQQQTLRRVVWHPQS